MNPDLETALSGEDEVPSHRLRWLLLVLLASIAAFAGTVWYLHSVSNSSNVSETDTQIAKMLAEFEPAPFQFVLVPDVETKIKLSAPDPESDKTDLEFYQTLANDEELLLSNLDDIMFNGQTYIEFINNHPNRDQIFQLHDEVRALTFAFGELFNRPSVQERAPTVTLITPASDVMSPLGGIEKPSPVYPSLRAVEIFLATEIMVRFDTELESFYRQQATNLVSEGVYHGQYSRSDAIAARTLVSRYFALLDEQNNTIFTNTNDEIN